MQRIAASLTALALVACAGPYSADGYCEKSAQTYCKFMYKCCTPSERISQFGLLILLGGAHTNYDECKDKATKLMCATLSPYGESVQAGRGTWDEAKAQECMQIVEKAADACDAQQYYEGTEGKDCELNGDIFKGSVQDGGECYFDAECSGEGKSCITRTSDDPDTELRTAEGTCRGLPADGEPCTETNECASNLYCDSSDVCRALKQNGSLCDYADECQSGRCGYNTTSSEYECMARIADGQACYSSSDCESGNCDDGTDVCAAKRANGTSCSADSECVSGNCDTTCQPAATDTGAQVTYDLCDGNDIDAPLMTLAVEPQPLSAP